MSRELLERRVLVKRERLRRRREAQARDLEAERARAVASLRWFVEAAWPQVEPRAFVPSRHVDALCEFLQDYFDQGRGADAVVNVPPRTGKSLICSVLFPAWVWAARDPGYRWICTSYADWVVQRDARRCRNLVNSEWWRERWPAISIPFQNTHAAADWSLSTGGWRISVTLSGQITGRHSDGIVIDDPIKPDDARLERAALADVQRVIDETLPLRLLRPAQAIRLLTMQRLHQRDPAGVLLSRPKTRRLVLPMHFAPERADPRDWRLVAGELLAPAYLSAEDVAADEERLTEYGRAGQLEQLPAPEGGSVVKVEWLEHRWQAMPRTDRGTWVQSWDCAFKGTDSTSFVVGQVWCATQSGHYDLVHQVRGRWGFVETLEQVLRLAAEYPQAQEVLVEEKANGAAVIDALRASLGASLVPVEPKGGKEARLHAVSNLFRAGQVRLPPAQPWVEAYVDELKTFPASANDDQVDATSQALCRLREERDGVESYLELVRSGFRPRAA